MSEPVRVGVIGAGVISQRGIIPHLTQADVRDRVRVEAICDPVLDRASEVAARHGIPHHYGESARMLDEADLDAVIVASPIGFHYRHGRQALEAGKHVHFNKTMTTTVDEATDLIQLAARSGLRIVASPGEVLRPHLWAIRDLIASGALGTLTWAVCGTAPGDYHVNERERQEAGALIAPDWYFSAPGGGPLYDTTVYALHALTTVLGPARRVTAMSGVRLPERDIGGRTIHCDADDTTIMVLDFEDNLYAMCYGVTYGSLTPGFDAAYFGTSGSISGLALNGRSIEFPGRELAEGAPGRNGLNRLLPHVRGSHREIGEAHVYVDVMQLVDWIRDGRASPVTAEHARHVIDIIESAYRSAESGHTQDLRTTFDLPSEAPLAGAMVD